MSTRTCRVQFHALIAFALVAVALAAAAGAGEAPAKPPFALHPVGAVEREDGEVRLRIDKEYAKALSGLDGFSHVWVLYWFDRNDTPGRRAILQVHPRGDRRNPLTGVFATRSPVRPNLTGWAPRSACPIGNTGKRCRGKSSTISRIRSSWHPVIRYGSTSPSFRRSTR